jgi:hypothetical protein
MTLGGNQQCWHLTVKELPKHPNLAPMKFHTPVLNPQLYKSPPYPISQPLDLRSVQPDEINNEKCCPKFSESRQQNTMTDQWHNTGFLTTFWGAMTIQGRENILSFGVRISIPKSVQIFM